MKYSMGMNSAPLGTTEATVMPTILQSAPSVPHKHDTVPLDKGAQDYPTA